MGEAPLLNRPQHSMWEVRVKVGLNFMGAEQLFGGAIGPVLETVAKADAMGVDLISTCDHLGFNAAAHAERRETHNFPYPIDRRAGQRARLR